ncbi:MAG: glycerate kinase type-2 family protein [Acidimicrobiia bacterium]
MTRSVVGRDPEQRAPLLAALAGGVEAVDPERAVERALSPDLIDNGRPMVLAFGKAALGMARGTEHAGLEATGLVVTPHPGHPPRGMEMIVAGHPLPDHGSARAGARALELARGLGPEHVMLCLISGGGSALLESPAGRLRLEDLVTTTRLLLTAGADIGQLNTVRKHLSRVKGGRLAEAIVPARLRTLVLSDVVGNHLGVIASGPTVPDPTTYGDALEVLDGFGLRERVPKAVLAHLQAGAAGRIPETPKDEQGLPVQQIVLVGDAGAAAEGARQRAAQEGLRARTVTNELEGEARESAAWCLSQAGPPGELLIFAGETTVTVRGPGSGGRNQEAALAAALEIEGSPDLMFAALGTDGIDGPTDAAGGLVDGRTVAEGARLGLDARDHLDRNDSYPYLRAVGDQLVTGPTGTNVGDLWLVWRT